ncbi:MAG: alpha/beta hydrolase [Myxococcales bacterium]|nr:alpha/beta hydrolase [Myxococcales bacterium]
MSSSQPEERRSPQGRSPAHRLAQGLDLCQPLLAACAPQLRLYPKLDASASAVFDVDAVAVANRLVTAVAQRYALPAPVFVWPPPEDPNALEAALCAYCELGVEDWRALVSDPHALAEVAALPDFGQEERRLVEVDGHPPVITYSQGPAGPAGKDAIVIVPPCGVPARLFRPWFAALGARHRVVTYENPYLFGDWRQAPEPRLEVAAEGELVAGVLRGLGIERAHLVAICGGAPIALATSMLAPERVASVAMCHGDLFFGPQTQRTPFQLQFQGLLREVTSGAVRARSLYEMFLDPALHYSVPTPLAPFVLVPYADLALFRRYAGINYALMAYDSTPAATALACPVLLVTSRSDRMTHPAASYQAQSLIQGSRLWERDAGNHHDALLPNADLFAALAQFALEAE